MSDTAPGRPSAIQRALERISRAPLGHASLIPQAPPVPIRTIVRRFWPFLRPYLFWVLIAFAPLMALPLIETVEIWLFQVVVDDVLTPGDLTLFLPLAAAFLGLTLLAGVLSFFDDVITTNVGERFTLAVRGEIFSHLLRQPPDALDRRRLGDLLARISGDVGAVEDLMVSAPGVIVSAVLRAVLFAGAMFLIDPFLAFISLLLAPLFWGAARLFASAARSLARERRRRSAGVMTLAEESLSHAALIQASGREADELDRLQAEGELVAQTEVASARLGSFLMPLVELIEVGGALVIMGLGTIALTEDRITLGQLLVFLTYLTQLYKPVRDFSALTTQAFTAAGGAERILEILDQPPEVVERPDAVDPGRAAGHLVLEGVSYAYADGPKVLRDISIDFEPGSVTAIVGPSGAGKSTLLKLLVRFADPTGGRILLDGRDIRDLTLVGLRRNVAIQLQDSQVLDASLADNVRYSRPDATDEEVREALKAAAAATFTGEFKAGQRTRLAQRGRRLSGGQRKRVEIARLLIQDAPVVVLDEPTAALDSATGRAVMQGITKLMAGRTVIVITHDPVALETADRVIGLEAGRLVSVTSALEAADAERPGAVEAAAAGSGA